MIQNLQSIKRYALLFLIVLFSTLTKAQNNIAPSSTAAGAPVCNTGACSTLNDLNFGTCGTQQMWLTSAATNPGSAVNITFTWSSVRVFNKITIHAGAAGTRYLTGGTVQIFNGSAWVTHTTFTQPNTTLCSYDINFNTIAASAVRIIDMTVGGSQASNVNFREVEIWESSLSNNDVGVAAIDSPSIFCGGAQNIVARVQNFGVNQVTGFNVNWSLNGTLQTPITSTAFLDTIGGSSPVFTQITLATGYTFPSSPATIIKAWTSLPNATVDTLTINDTATVAKAPSVSGNYTINPAGSGTSNFLTFDAAIAAITTAGVCGPVVFDVAPGTYTRTSAITIGNITGANYINTITFNGGNASTCIITGSIASSGIIVMNASKYVTFKNFTVTNTSATAPAGIAMVGSTNAITIKKCNVNVPIQTGTSSVGYCIVATGTTNGSGLSACSADSLLIDSNVTVGGGYGIVCYGSSSAAANRGIIITNNTVNSVNYMGGYIAYNYNPIKLKYNTFNLQGASYGYYGLYFYYNQSSNATISHEIIGNKMLNWAGYGIYLYYPAAVATAAKLIVNNNIISSSPGGYAQGIYGIYFVQIAATCQGEFYHNTVLMNGSPATTSYTCFYHSGSTATIIKNNIFGVYGGVAVPVYLATSPTGNLVNYNNYYNANTASTSPLIYRNAVFYNSTNFKNAANGGDSSFSALPSFVSRLPMPGNYHLTEGCDGAGVPTYVTADYDGTPRSTVTPNPGAYEFTGGVANNLKVVRVLSPFAPITIGSQDFKFLVKNIGNNSITSYNASYKHNTSSTITIPMYNTVGVCATDTAVFTGANQILVTSINQITAFTDSPNANPDADKTNDTLRVNLFAPLSGTYTVGGTTPDFADIASAASALQFGLAGPVTFDIRPGTYTGQVVVNGPILGGSATNTVTFEGNNNTNRILSTNTATASFLINNASYVTVQNLKVINAQSTAGIGVVGTASTYNVKSVTIKKCDVSLPILSSTTSTGYGIVFTGTAGGVGIAATGADSSIIDSNVVTGGGYGLVHYGSSNALYNRGVLIRGNLINNCNYTGAYVSYNYNPIKLLGNTFNMQSQNYGYYGVYFYYNQNSNTSISHEVIANRVNNFGGYGMYLYYPAASATAAKMKVYNNIVLGGTAGTTYPGYYGIYLYHAATNYLTDIVHNTVIMNNASATSTTYTCFYNTGSTLTVVKNNIFSVLAGSYTPCYLATAPATNTCNYNIYYNATNLISGSLVYRGAFYTPASYKTATAGGDSSFNMNPPFVSSNNLHITNGCVRGVDFSTDVPTDFDKYTRSTTPNIGAYEYPQVTLDITPQVVLAPSFPISLGSQDVRVLVRNNGATTVSSFDLTYRLNGGTAVTTSFSGSLSPCDTVSVYFTGSQQITLVNASNSLKVYTANPNAGTDLYADNDTLITALSTPMSGTYIIGTTSPSDYPSFTAAVDAVTNRGIGGAITFQVRTGTYPESFTVPAFIGSSPTNTVTFQSMANHVDSVVILPATTDLFITRLNNASFVNFKKITFMSTTLVSSQNGINLVGAVYMDTIMDCKITMAVQSSYTNYIVYGTGLTLSADGVKFINNNLSGSYYGVYVYGTSTSRFRNFGFIGNNILNTYYYSFYSYYSNGLVFHKNTVIPTNLYSGNINYFMYADSLTITNNIWNFTNNCTMYLGYYSTNPASQRGLVANNVITGSGLMASASIYLGYYSNNIDYLHNSINVPSSTQAAYIYNSGTSNVNYKNNIFANTAAGNAAYFSVLPTLSISDVDYNNYYTATGSLIGGISPQTTLAAWRTACNCDKNSLNYNPGFTSATNLVPNASSANVWSVNGRANHVNAITTSSNVLAATSTDITGAPRPANPADGVADLGAYEVLPTSTPPLCTAVPATPVAGGTQVFLFGSDTVAKVTYDAFATAPSSLGMRLYTGTVPPTIGSASVYPYFYANTIATTGTYNYTLSLNYKLPWVGNITGGQSNIKLASKAPANGWMVYGTYNSIVDSTLKSVASTIALNDLPSIFTIADDVNPLPVSLVKFAGKKVEMNADLTWATATEKNSSHFVIQRSLNGKDFTSIGKVTAAGNTERLSSYSFQDQQVFGITTRVYYRLQMVDRDGSFTYSNTIVINVDEVQNTTNELSVYPNPFSNKVFVELELNQNEMVELRDISGRVVYKQELDAKNQFHELNIPSELNNGVYFLVLGGNQQKVSKLIKN